jgi:GntR family transcriptional regulator
MAVHRALQRAKFRGFFSNLIDLPTGNNCISVCIHIMNADGFTIQPGSTEPIYRQIGAQLRRLIASGQLPPGEDLPSVRDVAVQHAINPMTVSRAYSQLEAEGLLKRVRGKGMVVANGAALSSEQRLARFEVQLAEVARQARELKLPARLVAQRLKSLLEEPE